MSRLVLSLSLCINLLLLTSFVAARVDSTRVDSAHIDSTRGNETPAVRKHVDSSAQAGAAIGDFSRAEDYYRALLDRGLTEAESRPLVRAWIEARRVEIALPAALPFWKKDEPEAQRVALERRWSAEQRVRNELLSVYGTGIETDPRFADLFRPLGARFDFLSPETQRIIARWEQEKSLDRLFAVTGTVTALPTCRPPGPGPGSSPERASESSTELAELIGESAAREYGLRASVLASALRNSRLDLDEHEFREAYGLLSELGSGPGPARQLALRESLKQLLGEQRYDRLWAGRDRTFAQLLAILRPLGFSEHEIDAAYSVVNRGQERLLALAGGQQRGAGFADELRFIRDERLRRLTGLLGAAAGEAVVAGLDHAASPSFQPSAPAC